MARFIGKVPAANLSLFDLLVVGILVTGGITYHWCGRYWAVGLIGESEYGDAQFWWDGAVQVSEGILTTAIGQGFRPGYFFLAGLTLPVLGSHFLQFHKALLVAFFGTGTFFYLALRYSFGRFAAAIALALLVFNPFTAEWLATSTTDGTGLVLHVLALGCLLFGARHEARRLWLVGFGIFFALASLTRPIMTPFIGVVILALLFQLQSTFRQRAINGGTALLAFLLPTLLWMGLQRLTIGQWSISTGDASTFYAASDPSIQCWNSQMYIPIQDVAKARFKTDKPTEADLNRVFWGQALANYRIHYNYHLNRLIPSFWQVAGFSPKIATHGTDQWQLWLLVMVSMGLSLRSLLQQSWLRGTLLLAISLCVWSVPQGLVFMTCAGAALATLRRPRDDESLQAFFLAAYWLIGVVGLLGTGGVWGPPLCSVTALNALGYRLGAQAFFMGDVLTVYFLLRISTLNPSSHTHTRGTLCRLWQRIYECPTPLASTAIIAGLGATVLAVLSTYALGTGIVAWRWCEHRWGRHQPFPDLQAVATACRCRHSLGPNRDRAPSLPGDFTMLQKLLSGNADSGDIIVTAGVGPFLWNLAGQNRAQMMMYTQSDAVPFTSGTNSLIVEVPQRLRAIDWNRVQGAFVLRRFADRPCESHLPYFTRVPAVRAFVPLSPDRSDYNFERASWFPLVKYASQLEASGELHCRGGTIKWIADVSDQQFKRRCVLTPAEEGGQLMTLTLDPTGALGEVRLDFECKWCLETGTAAPKKSTDMYLTIWGCRGEQREKLWEEHEVSPPAQTSSPRRVSLDLSDRGFSSIDMEFAGLPSQASVCIYEFNLSASDFSTNSRLKTHP
jgi:hypothetical protein